MDVIFLILLFAIPLAFFFQHLKNNSSQQAAARKVYAVRDELMRLVAKNKLQKDSSIFQYYYKQTNKILSLIPGITLEGTLDSFLYLQDSKSLHQSLDDASMRAEQMLKLVEKESGQVSDVISNYYEASKDLILSHSSVLQMLYIDIIKNRTNIPFKDFLRESTKTALKTLRFADEEAQKFRCIGRQQAASQNPLAA